MAKPTRPPPSIDWRRPDEGRRLGRRGPFAAARQRDGAFARRAVASVLNRTGVLGRRAKARRGWRGRERWCRQRREKRTRREGGRPAERGDGRRVERHG